VLVHADRLRLLGVFWGSRNNDFFALIDKVFRCLARHPDTLARLFIIQLVENAVAPKHNKVVVSWDLKLGNVRFRFHNIGIAAPKLKFGFRVAESTANWKPSR
jgi:hypothetical protein